MLQRPDDSATGALSAGKNGLPEPDRRAGGDRFGRGGGASGLGAGRAGGTGGLPGRLAGGPIPPPEQAAAADPDADQTSGRKLNVLLDLANRDLDEATPLAGSPIGAAQTFCPLSRQRASTVASEPPGVQSTQFPSTSGDSL